MIAPDLAAAFYKISVWALPLVLAITLHEAAHALVARRLGDDTAQRLGRVSLNPLRHVDPFGTVLLPGILLLTGSPFLFGWAKPVPINLWRMHNPRRDMVLVALAGPGINLLLALLSALLLHLTLFLPPDMAAWAEANLANSVLINVILAVFNMIPLPPLDGGRVAVGVLPQVLALPLARMERYGMAILLGALLVLPVLGINLFQSVLWTPIRSLAMAIYALAGVI